MGKAGEERKKEERHNHPFVSFRIKRTEREKMDSSRLYFQGTHHVTEAIKYDNNGEYPKALEEYTKGLEYIIAGIKYDERYK